MKRNLRLPCLLAASPNLMDANFYHAVILLLEHDDEGALGFIINNKSQMTMGEVVAYNEMEIPPGIPVWNAGPIDSSSGFVLHNRSMDTFEQEIAPGVCLSASQDSLKKLIEEAYDSSFHMPEFQDDQNNKDVRYPYRLLVGYSGWGPGQLEDEMKDGTWIEAPLDLNILFNSVHDSIWEMTLESVGIKQSTHMAPTPSPVHWLH